MKTLPLCVLLVTFCLTACQEPEIEDPDTGLSSVLTPSATGVTLEASALGDFTLLDNHSIAEDEELAFPLVGMIPYLFKLAGGEDLRAFADKAAKQGFSEEDYLLLLDVGFFALTKVRRELYPSIGMDLMDPRSIITSLISTEKLTKLTKLNSQYNQYIQYNYKIQQDYLVPNCSLGLKRCMVKIDLDLNLKWPNLFPSIASSSNSYAYIIFFDNLELELVNFTLSNSISILDLTLEPKVSAITGISEYLFNLDDSDQNQLLANLTNIEETSLNLSGQFSNLFTADDGSIKTSVVEGNLIGSIASTVLTSDLTADSADGEIKGADYHVQLRSEVKDVLQ